MKTNPTRFLLAILAMGLVAAACGGDDGPTSGEGICPSPLVIQTDWFPESEHGALYQMVGDDYTVDTNNQIVSGSLVSQGEDTDIDIEVRTGGPAIGFQPVSTQMYAEPNIHIGYVSTDEAALFFADNPTIAVVAPLEKNPQIIMWDPETYPNVTSIADLGREGVTINHFAAATYVEVFVNQGILTADQVDPSYDGSPARFIAEGGTIAQQGFASAEPHQYQNVYAEWGKPVNYQLIHDAGLEMYSQALAIRAGDLENMRECLEWFVPVVQQAVVDFADDPARANEIIIDAVEQYDSSWTYDGLLANFSVNTQKELGLIGNGPDDTVGNMVTSRVQGVIDQMSAAGMDVGGATAGDIVTNEFIDENIGFDS